MSFSLIRAGGFVTGTRLLASELQNWQTAFVNAIDGAGGGSYTLAAPLSITGDTVTLDDVVIGGDLTVGTTGADTMTVAATASFAQPLTANSVIASAVLLSSGSTTLGTSGANTLQVNATTTLAAAVTCSTTLTVTGTATFNGDVTIGNSGSDAATVVAASTFSGSATFNSTVETSSNVDFKGTTALNGVGLYYRNAADDAYLKVLDSDGSDDIEFGNITNDIYVLANALFGPYADNTITCGGASNRFTAVYAVNGTIQTSDESLKTPFAAFPDALLDAWLKRSPGLYSWTHSTDGKLNAGWGAQSLAAAFEEAGLDPHQYGAFDLTHYDGKERWGLNYSQCLSIEAAALRRKVASLEERLAALEAKLA